MSIAECLLWPYHQDIHYYYLYYYCYYFFFENGKDDIVVYLKLGKGVKTFGRL